MVTYCLQSVTGVQYEYHTDTCPCTAPGSVPFTCIHLLCFTFVLQTPFVLQTWVNGRSSGRTFLQYIYIDIFVLYYRSTDKIYVRARSEALWGAGLPCMEIRASYSYEYTYILSVLI